MSFFVKNKIKGFSKKKIHNNSMQNSMNIILFYYYHFISHYPLFFFYRIFKRIDEKKFSIFSFFLNHTFSS